MRLSRRNFLIGAGAGLASAAAFPRLSPGATDIAGEPHFFFEPGEYQRIDSAARRFHLCAYYDEIFYEPRPGKTLDKRIDLSNPVDLPAVWKDAGITDIWFTHYVTGGWYQDWKALDRMRDKIKSIGLTPHLVNVAFGHPAFSGKEYPEGWKPCHYLNGDTLWGSSCHAPADEACVRFSRAIADHCGPCDVFFDDEFRCSEGPDDIGGCICPECKAEFLKKTGFPESQWETLLEEVRANENIPDVRLWIDYQCDKFAEIFHQTEETSPEIDFGMMVMGMGSERAGIRLDNYRNKLLRVGEWMFTDEQYNSTKNKTIELFSSLFHSRFSTPGRLFSETSIIRPLSAENLASKLAVATLSDVRNTMYFCPIPPEYWTVLAPRMKKEAFFHQKILHQKPRGPFKHFWGIDDRYMAGYDAFSLFLSMGVPFEVCDTLPNEGYAFLGKATAAAIESGRLEAGGAKYLVQNPPQSDRLTFVEESFEEMFDFRRSLLDDFRKQEIPYAEEETPVVLSEYPECRTILIWNIEAAEKTIHVRRGNQSIGLSLAPLDSAMLTVNANGSMQEIVYPS